MASSDMVRRSLRIRVFASLLAIRTSQVLSVLRPSNLPIARDRHPAFLNDFVGNLFAHNGASRGQHRTVIGHDRLPPGAVITGGETTDQRRFFGVAQCGHCFVATEGNDTGL